MKFLIIAIISLNCFAISQEDSKDLFTRYLDSIRSKKEDLFRSIVTDKYYKDLKNKKMIQEMFEMNKKSKKKLNFDIKIKKAGLDKDTYFINIKDKSQKNYGHNWFKVIKVNNKYKIDGTEFFD